MPEETASWPRRLGVAGLVLAAAIFSFLNAGERVTLNIGFTTLYRISLVGLVFAIFLLGMVAMFLFGLRQDRRIRALLRNRAAQPFYNYRESPPPNPPDPTV